MKEKLTVKRFGPIKDISINVKAVNIFIGETASGKSTVAKLIAIFKSYGFLINCNLENWKSLIKDYNIDYILDETYIRFENDNFYWEIDQNKFETNFPYQNIFHIPTVISGILEEKVENSPNLTNMAISLLLLSSIEIANIKVSYKDDPEKEKKVNELLGYLSNLKSSLLHNDFSKLDDLKKHLRKLGKIISDDVSVVKPIYIPAERIFLSMVAESIFGLMKQDVTIAQCIKDFGAHFERARKETQEFLINVFNIRFKYENNQNTLLLKDNIKIKLEASSSGFQAIIPTLLVINYFSKEKEEFVKNGFIIEEPELNLYPNSQKFVIEEIIERCVKNRNLLIVTTHSPYILSTVDNMIKAKTVFNQKPELKNKINDIVPSTRWIDFENTAAYFFSNEGACDILDYERHSIDASQIDNASADIGNEYDLLLKLQFEEGQQ